VSDLADKVNYEVTEILSTRVVARRLSDGVEVNFEDVDAVQQSCLAAN
jgi:hypothetical protein